MNNIKNLRIKGVFIFLLSIFIISCDEYLDVNKNPDVIEENPGIFLIPSIQVSIGSIIGGTFALHTSLWNQYYNQNNTANQYREIIDMLMQADNGDTQWDELYSSALSDIQKLKEFANDSLTYNPRLNLIATVLESYTFQVIFDAYGQAPYSEAFKGETERNFNPSFERGEDVYPQLVTAIDNAISEYNAYLGENDNADPNLRADQQDKDYFFNGDLGAWIQFANSVKLKIAMRNIDYDQAWSMSVITPMEANPNYITMDVVLDIFSAEVNKENPLYAQDQNLNTQINLVANRTLSEFWTINGDPREPLTYEANSAGNNLLEHGDHRASSSTNPPNSNRKPILDPTRPVYFLTTSEINFFRAELAVRGLITADAKSLYDQAVREAFTRVGATAASADSLLAPGMPYEFSAIPDSQIRDIGVQKWAAMANVNPFEGFQEVNRLDYPPIVQTSVYNPEPPVGNEGAFLYLPKNTVLGTDYIKRYMLPESEALSNANFPETQTSITDRLWWDVN